MSRDPDFDSSADMRLIELQRAALGLTAPARPSWESRFSTDAVPGADAPDVEASRGPVVAVEATATPLQGLIPGAVVTATLSLSNIGSQPALRVVAGVPIPGGATYRPGSFQRDGRTLFDDEAEAFFGAGVSIPQIVPGSRATFVWKLGVKVGSGPLVIAPQVRAEGSAVIGGRPVAIGRNDQASTAFSEEVARTDAALYESKPLIPVSIPADELPIYELDAEEQLVYEAADAALSSAVKPAATPPPPKPVPEQIAAVPRSAVVVYGRFDRTTLAFFQRTFGGGKPPTILQHCIFGGALACPVLDDASDPFHLKRHLDAQSQVLHRIVLHEKLGKRDPIVDYAGELLAELGAIAPGIVRAPLPIRDAIVLAAELSDPTLAVLRKISDERGRWDFVKARQLTLALQAQRAIGVTDVRAAATLENALRAYAQTAMTALQKLFVRIRVDGSTGILFQREPALDDAARFVLGAFESLFGGG